MGDKTALRTWQKSPTYVTKEPNMCVGSVYTIIPTCVPTHPIEITEEFHMCDKRALRTWQNSPTYETKEPYIRVPK